MATFIPLTGEISECPAPKSEVSISLMLGASSSCKRIAPDGSTWWEAQPVVLSENERATRFYTARHGTPGTFGLMEKLFVLHGDVLYLSAEETQAMTGLGGADDYVPVHGRTYDVRDKLKAIGARWFPLEKAWKVPKSRLAEANDIVRRGP